MTHGLPRVARPELYHLGLENFAAKLADQANSKTRRPTMPVQADPNPSELLADRRPPPFAADQAPINQYLGSQAEPTSSRPVEAAPKARRHRVLLERSIPKGMPGWIPKPGESTRFIPVFVPEAPDELPDSWPPKGFVGLAGSRFVTAVSKLHSDIPRSATNISQDNQEPARGAAESSSAGQSFLRPAPRRFKQRPSVSLRGVEADEH